MEYIIVGDTEKHKDCLVYTCGCDRKCAEKALDKLLNNPDSTDLYFRRNHTNFRIEEVDSSKCWWNDPFLAN